MRKQQASAARSRKRGGTGGGNRMRGVYRGGGAATPKFDRFERSDRGGFRSADDRQRHDRNKFDRASKPFRERREY